MKTDMYQYEKYLWEDGFDLVAGIDEAGRGPLAGPVVAAAVILPRSNDGYPIIPGLRDSKQLSKKQREILYQEILRKAIAWRAYAVSAKEIDRLNILRATQNAMIFCVQKLSRQPEYVLIDAVTLDLKQMPSVALIKGDQRSATIAAASIIAKVTRDRIMDVLHRRFPQYCFNHNRGYATQKHLSALRQYGPCPFHRFSFAPVRNSSASQNCSLFGISDYARPD